MAEITIQISEEELKGVMQAYQTLQNFLEKITSPNELYQAEFLEGLREAQAEVQKSQTSEVKIFADFVQ
ncbi:hypothetical protein BH24ACI2_BH24ACI2_08840 [soil metagenome]|jgi:hypothetical protein|nr:hypothetical protein [Acidobacteriota bacterium]